MLRLPHLTKVWKFSDISSITAYKMFSTEGLCNEAKGIFECSVRAVQPEELIRKSIHIVSNSVEIQGNRYLMNKNVHIIGFGKAVMGMALALQDLLQDHIVSGMLSIPVGMQNSKILENRQKFSSQIQIFEGALNNIPDSNSLLAAHKISDLVTSLGKTSLLFVLISGGGSALLPYPKFPLTLEEKQNVIKILASKGATIEEINIVRKRLSALKGGGLVQLARPAKVISLILSDVIGDPLGVIASGPTVENTDDPSLPISIIEKYGIKDVLPQSAVKLLEDISKERKTQKETFDFVSNFIIGNNITALQAAADKAAEFQYTPIVMTTKLSGIASNVGRTVIQLVDAALQQNCNKVKELCDKLSIKDEICNYLFSEMKELKSKYKGFCLLFGGETTVQIKGKGTGGRNQELALAASLELCNYKSKSAVVLLSAGTDGIDGPTDAAGALANSFIVDIAKNENLDIQNYLNDNDSYNFYNILNNGQWHFKIGHTGTNVMDIIVVLIKINE